MEIIGLSLGEILRWSVVALLASTTLSVIAGLVLRHLNGNRAIAATPWPSTMAGRLKQLAGGGVLMLTLTLLLRRVFGVQSDIALIFGTVFGVQLNLLLWEMWIRRRR